VHATQAFARWARAPGWVRGLVADGAPGPPPDGVHVQAPRNRGSEAVLGHDWGRGSRLG
jgi:hypothetical protein